MEKETQNLSDHDLLITLHSEVRGMRIDIQNLKSDTADRIKTLEQKVGSLEVWRGWLIGGMAILAFVISTVALIKK